MIRVLFVAMAFLSVSAMADTEPCSAGIQDPPVLNVVSSPVRLTFRDTVHAVLSAPSVTIAGNEITVVQTEYETLVAPPASCNRQSVSLDDFAPGRYTLTWKYQTLQNFTLETFSFAFTVPEASPCVAGVSIQPQSPIVGQPVSILYSATFRGFLETPVVALDGSQIAIDQQAVIADPAFSGHVPCARGIVQIGGLQAGSYSVTVRSTTFGPFSDAFTVRQPVRSRAVRGH
ncbi:MAG: hypothetical protein QOF63_1021 [Thermoanaerobaculia bacterium]|jgi:hypothetical protein|nr:hypothetical protein [Thermoanaerobaculia bacterium]